MSFDAASLTLGLILGWAVATPISVLLILYLQGGARGR